MTARDLHAWLRGLHAVSEPSVDRIVVGAPETPVRGIGVVWMPTWNALRAAEAQGVNVVVAHEPTFFNHHDLGGFDGASPDLPAHARAIAGATRDAKARWIKERGLVIIRCHDVLDAMPGGVVDTLAGKLGFHRESYLRQWSGYRVVRVAPAIRAAELAQRLASAFASLGQPGIGFYGDLDRRVGALGLGTGYGCELWRFVELGAEMAVTIDDRIKTWTEGEWADDAGFPLAVINHGASEEWGVRRLAEILAATWSDIPVRVIAQGFSARWIRPRG